MATETYNPAQAAAAPLIGASPSTIRNWCKAYASVLSEGANPSMGTERRLTQQDVAKLQQVKVWRDQRMPVQEIIGLLQAAASANEPAPLTIDVAPTQPTETPEDAPDGGALLPAVVEGINTRIESVERRLDAQLEETRAVHRDRIAMFIWSAVIGMIGALILFTVAYLLVTMGPR